MRAFRFLDFAVLAFALPVFIAAGLPLIGWAAVAVGWTAQRALQLALERRARASGDPRTVAGLMTGSMIARAWIMALAIFGVGLAERAAGLAAAVLTIALFTVYFSTSLGTAR